MRGTFGHLSSGALLFFMGETILRVSTLHKPLHFRGCNHS